MRKLTYISNLNLTNTSGGMSGINSATYNQLKNKFEIIDYIMIQPKRDLVAKFVNKLRKYYGVKMNYHFYSENRLNNIADTFDEESDKNVAVFFHGFTPWIKTHPKCDYYCFNDACFETYVSLYNDRTEFCERDLNRIFKQEKEWLSNAKKVFFQSNWALEQTKKAYHIAGHNFEKVGVGGYIDIPESDHYKGTFEFLFISREFKPKGGFIAIEAFKIIRKKFPECQLNVIGDAPPFILQQELGVNYLGFINKNIDSEREKLIEVFKRSFMVLHPTKKDINPLILSELGYYGCPAISSNSFAIPEYVIDGKTGFLLNDENDPVELSNRMEYLITHKKEYMLMRENTRKNAIENNTWDAVGNRIFESMLKY